MGLGEKNTGTADQLTIAASADSPVTVRWTVTVTHSPAAVTGSAWDTPMTMTASADSSIAVRCEQESVDTFVRWQ